MTAEHPKDGRIGYGEVHGRVILWVRRSITEFVISISLSQVKTITIILSQIKAITNYLVQRMPSDTRGATLNRCAYG